MTEMIDGQVPVLTVDGPGGSGKGTICQLLAQKLGWNLLDSGAMYRVLALAALNHGVDFQNEQALEVLAGHIDVQFIPTECHTPIQIILEGEEATKSIRTEEIGVLASKLAAYPGVRAALLGRQRAFREKPGLVADGRDMGTVVFPDALLKVFLTASVEERAERRFKQLKEQGVDANLGGLLREISERDERDRNRSIAPLTPAEDAILVDSTGLTIHEVFDLIIKEASKRFSID